MPETVSTAPLIEHLLPPGVTPGSVELSLVVPALNEAITAGEFVDWCHEGLKRAGVSGQILIVDSSIDSTPDIVLARGGEVLRVPKRGLGQAYIDAIPYIRGQWIVMGDVDLTYDFRELAPFVEEFRHGAEFVMGNRFSGNIEAGAMPALHHYFGTPLTTWILNRIYGAHFSDIHCGMRGLTREALLKIDLKSRSWEYASEMVLKAAALKLRIAQVPVKYYKDREGRVSHHRRIGWISPWIAGWQNLEIMLVYSPDSFLLKPGFALFAVGLSFSLCSGLLGPLTIFGIGFNLHWMLLAVTFTTLGYSCIQVAVLARIMHGLRSGIAGKIQKMLTYNRGLLAAGACGGAGLVLVGRLVHLYVLAGYRLVGFSYSAILGLLFIILGFQTFGFTLLLEMSQRVVSRSGRAEPLRTGAAANGD